MDFLPLHPKLVHLPIALAVLMPVVFGGLLFAWMRGLLPKRAWLIAVALQAFLVAGSIASLRTGEADEERVEKVVAEARIEAHEEVAQLFTAVSAGVLGLALLTSALRQEKLSRSLAGLSVAGALLVLFLGYRTGEAGGRLVYQYGAASAFTQQGAPAAGGETGAPAVASQNDGDDDSDD